ncbi:MAG: STAS domain-containing protein [Streptosporangiaceae bacterium]
MDETHEVTGPVVVPLPPEIDMTNAERVSGELIAAARPGRRVVVGDLTATTFCDSAGIRALGVAHQHASRAKVQLRLAVAPDGAVRRVLEIMDLVAVLSVYPSVADAVAGSSGAG